MSIHRTIPDLDNWILRIEQGGQSDEHGHALPAHPLAGIEYQTKAAIDRAGMTDFDRSLAVWQIKKTAHDAWLASDPDTRGPEPEDPGAMPSPPTGYEYYQHLEWVPFLDPSVALADDIPTIYTRLYTDEIDKTLGTWSAQNSYADVQTENTLVGNYHYEYHFNERDYPGHAVISDTGDLTTTTGSGSTTTHYAHDFSTSFGFSGSDWSASLHIADSDLTDNSGADAFAADSRSYDHKKAVNSESLQSPGTPPFIDHPDYEFRSALTRETWTENNLESSLTRSSLLSRAGTFLNTIPNSDGLGNWGGSSAGAPESIESRGLVYNWPKGSNFHPWPDQDEDISAFGYYDLGGGLTYADMQKVRYRFTLPTGYGSRPYYKVEWDIYFFPKVWLDWKARKDAHDTWQRSEPVEPPTSPPDPHAAWVTSHAAWASAEPPVPGAEPTGSDAPSLLSANSWEYSTSGGATPERFSSWYELAAPAGEGYNRARNVRVTSWRSRYGTKPTHWGQQYPTA
jgi:hypothetical protein